MIPNGLFYFFSNRFPSSFVLFLIGFYLFLMIFYRFLMVFYRFLKVFNRFLKVFNRFLIIAIVLCHFKYRVAARFLEVKILTFPDHFWTFSLPKKINKFLAWNWVLLETRPKMVKSLFPYKASGAFFPDKERHNGSFQTLFDSLRTVLYFNRSPTRQVTDHANFGSKKSG